jgi:hypothetical protein
MISFADGAAKHAEKN